MTLLRITMLVSLLGIANIAYAEGGNELLLVPCTGCHLPEGAYTSRIGPSIYGRPAAELELTLQALKSGARQSTLMMRLLQGYSEAELSEFATLLANTPSESTSKSK